jgi:hypothetical protein
MMSPYVYLLKLTQIILNGNPNHFVRSNVLFNIHIVSSKSELRVDNAIPSSSSIAVEDNLK